MDTKQNYTEEDKMSSAYNEAGLQIQRLHNLWLSAEESSIKRNYVKWNSILDAIERELYSDILKQSNNNVILNKLLELKMKYISGGRYIKVGCMGGKVKGSNIMHCMNALDERHKILKNVQEKSGKGSIYRDMDMDDMD